MIEHKLLKDNSPIHVFYEDLIFSSDKLRFGFEILINWKGMKELFTILWNGGEFIAKNGSWSRKFSFDLDSKVLTQVYKKQRSTEETIQKDRLNEDQIKELSQLLANTYNQLHADMVLKTKEKNVKISVSMKIRNNVKTITETAPESPKEEKVEETKPNEESLTTAQKNDDNDYADLGEAINTILKVEGLSKEDLSKKENFGKKFAIYGLMYPTQAEQFENRYKIKVSVDTYAELRKFFE